MDILKSYVEVDSLSKSLAEKFDYGFDVGATHWCLWPKKED